MKGIRQSSSRVWQDSTTHDELRRATKERRRNPIPTRGRKRAMQPAGTESAATRLLRVGNSRAGTDRPDGDWVRRAQAGDRNAFSELVRRHQSSVYRYLFRMLGSRDDALELTQDAFVRAWQALPQWQPEAQFRTWLLRIASNAALDALRRRQRVEFVALEESFDAPAPGPGPERQAQARQEMQQLEESLRKLTPEHRDILLLREVEELSYEEIGRVLSVSEGTVKSRLARARAALIEMHGRMK
jgi:RNA polymerase sigma-70 factor (ECF subfamily)